MDLSWDSLSSGKQAVALNSRLQRAHYRGSKQQKPGGTGTQRLKPQSTCKSSKRKSPDDLDKVPKVKAEKGSSLKLAKLEHDMSREIKVGSDCSGLSTEVHAFSQLHLSHRTRTMFASEVDAKVRVLTLLNNPRCERVYESCCIAARTHQRSLR